MEFLWVRWLGAEPWYRSGSKVARLPKVGFVEDTDEDTFGFLDPDLIIWGAHLIPDFNSGRTSGLLSYDFITDPSRCNKRFLVSPGCLHLKLATNCLGLMNKELEENMLSLPEYALNSEIERLKTRIGTRVSIGLQYACRSWYNHLAETRGEVTDLLPHLRLFLEEKFLVWLEVLSVLGDIGGASDGLAILIQWLQEVYFNLLLHFLALT